MGDVETLQNLASQFLWNQHFAIAKGDAVYLVQGVFHFPKLMNDLWQL